LKYRLPSDPNVWVDLVDDDDVELMFDEWQDACMQGGGGGGTIGSGGGVAVVGAASPTYATSTTSIGSQSTFGSCKLHLFVQWRRPVSSMGSSLEESAAAAAGGEGSAEGGASGESSGGGDGTRTTGSPETSTPDTNATGSGGENNNAGAIQVFTPENQEKGGDGKVKDGEEEKKDEKDDDTGNNYNNTVSSAAAIRRQNRQRRVKSSNNNNNNAVGSSKASSHHHHTTSIDLPDLIERMEIIQPCDISLVKFLGSGGYGDVYLGRWHGCEVAVKCLNPALFFQGAGAGGDPGAINRAAVTDLIKEADMLGSLRHPNVVWVYGMVLPASSKIKNGGTGDDDDGEHEDGFTSSEGDSDGDNGGDNDGSCPKQRKKQRQRNIIDVIQAEAGTPSMMPGILRPPALVTEYMAGGSLKTALARKADIVAGPLTRIVLALDAAKGVEYLHSKRLVHFDLKSGNLLLGYRDRRPICKVADFGLAREKAQTFVSGVTSQRGTLPWIAPEILRTPDAVTEAADVYSFAIVMWELWTGREPWENTNFHALMLQLANPELKLRPPIPGSDEWEGPEGSAPPELAPGWRNLMERCWEEDPNNRPPFTQVVKELRGMISAIRPPRGGRGEGIGGGNGIAVARGG
jgi:serine/threonine protein kinase